MRTLLVIVMIQLVWLAPVVVAGESGRAGERPQIIVFDAAEHMGQPHLLADHPVGALGVLR
jgi:hypothetical protein